ncbi:zinc ribbon domain-containing protein [Leptolyngbya sp. BC1307]|uniref:zinc ribbon domain-containing protein n=1 Tax=Leptolyngbya sp. BC1307 TaxID=2029589 RepID=UPI000EFD0D59|nr:zinc ribbon domain-containing protein [Leptolyngbya sp. BC1307]
MAIAAAYQYELGSNQVLYLSNQDEFTSLTVASRSAGQQQQSGSRYSTGKWTAAPMLHRLAEGIVVTISAAKETYYLQIQGGQTQMSSDRTSDFAAQLAQSQPTPMQPTEVPSSAMPPMKPMTPMQPMQPMKPMQMNASPMTMSMGDMEMSPGDMRMGDMTLSSASAKSASAASSSHPEGSAADDASAKVKRFCAQCGSAIQSGDSPSERLRQRFCAYCGTSLQ